MTKNMEFWNSKHKHIALSFVLVLLTIIGAIPTDTNSQLWVGFSVLAVILVINELKQIQTLRLIFFACVAFIMLRYFFWRTFYTLGSDTFLGTLFGTALYLAEAYCIILAFLGMYINIFHVRREGAKPTGEQNSWPSVDVFIPSYNESTEILRDTLIAASQIRYPREKLNVYLCDDGGTVAKRNSADPEAAALALRRHEDLKTLCAQLGVNYLTREKNDHAKAGNINEAIKHTNGDLIALFDADHIPSADFLERTTGYFQQDSKLFLVQTPHFFINPDPVEKNLGIFSKVPGENDMFYSAIQPGLDFWNSAFFCGSAAIIKREHLLSVGGMKGESITEDCEAALMMHSEGLNSIYVERPMVAGLQPETYASFIVQRLRWAQGMVQIFLLHNPLRVKNLTLLQRLSYFSNTFFWFFSYVRFIFIIAPAMYLIFGQHIYTASADQVLAYTLPQFLVSLLIMDYMYGKVRTPFVSEVYEILQSMYAFVAISKVIASPRSPTFKVTPKGEGLQSEYVSSLAWPFYLIYAVSLISIGFGIWRYEAYPAANERTVTIITMGWEIFNLIILNTALGVLYEKNNVRISTRIPADIDCKIVHDGISLVGRVLDLTMHGMKFVFNHKDQRIPNLTSGTKVSILIMDNSRNTEEEFEAVIRASKTEMDITTFGLQFLTTPENLEDYKRLISVNYGDSERWVNFTKYRQTNRMGLWRGFAFILALGTKSVFQDYRKFIAHVWSIIRLSFLDSVTFYLTGKAKLMVLTTKNWFLGVR